MVGATTALEAMDPVAVVVVVVVAGPFELPLGCAPIEQLERALLDKQMPVDIVLPHREHLDQRMPVDGRVPFSFWMTWEMIGDHESTNNPRPVPPLHVRPFSWYHTRPEKTIPVHQWRPVLLVVVPV